MQWQKYLYTFVICMMFPVLAHTQNTAKDVNYLLHTGAAGGLELGMDSSAFYSVFDGYKTRFAYIGLESYLVPVIEVYLDSEAEKPSLVVQITEELDWKVWRIRVHDQTYKTEKNIGIGSTLGDIKAAYGELERSAHREGELCAEVPQLQLHFELDFNGYRYKGNFDSIPNDTKVLSVVVF